MEQDAGDDYKGAHAVFNPYDEGAVFEADWHNGEGGFLVQLIPNEDGKACAICVDPRSGKSFAGAYLIEDNTTVSCVVSALTEWDEEDSDEIATEVEVFVGAGCKLAATPKDGLCWPGTRSKAAYFVTNLVSYKCDEIF